MAVGQSGAVLVWGDAVSLCTCDYEPCQVWSESMPRARKQHLCTCCGGFIEHGETYQRIFSVFDGAADTTRRCPDCLHVIAEVGRTWMEDCGGWSCLPAGPLDAVFYDAMERLFCEVGERGGIDVVGAQVRRIVGMQRALAKARGGSILWQVPSWAEEGAEDDE